MRMKELRHLVLVGMVVLVGVALLGAGADKKPTTPVESREDWQRLIESERWQDRRRGRRLLLAERKKTIEKLLAVVRAPLEKNEEFFDHDTPRNTAMLLLGEMRAEEAVPELMLWLTPKEGQATGIDAQTNPTAAGSALIEIGLPSVRALLHALKGEGCVQRERETKDGRKDKLDKPILTFLGLEVYEILNGLLGPDLTEFVLEELLKEKGLSAHEKENLQLMLTFLRDPRQERSVKIMRGRFKQKRW